MIGERRELILRDGAVILPRPRGPGDHPLREQQAVVLGEVRAGALDHGILPRTAGADDGDKRTGHATRTPSRHTPRTTGTGAPDGW